MNEATGRVFFIIIPETDFWLTGLLSLVLIPDFLLQFLQLIDGDQTGCYRTKDVMVDLSN
jgi:hypothetical protein